MHSYAITGLEPSKQRSVVRRFRPGLDYTLATPSSWVCGADDVVLDAVLCFVGTLQYELTCHIRRCLSYTQVHMSSL